MSELAALILGLSSHNAVEIKNKHAFSNIDSPLQNVVKVSDELQVFVPMHGSVFMICKNDRSLCYKKKPWYN